MNWLDKIRTYRILRKFSLPDHEWRETIARLPLLKRLDANEKAHLRVLTTLFIHEKSFSGVQGLDLSLEMKIIIAAQACLEILYLGLDYFAGWHEIVVYPDAFRVERETTDEIGLVQNNKNTLSGESWIRGPVILSWDDVERDSYTLRHGRHVVLHEFAHKLDMLNGRANGMPPLHPNMPVEEWTDSLSKAYEQLKRRIKHHHGEINPYAAQNPAEFFAVICEYFFTAPQIIVEEYPLVYDQLKRYFLQDPLSRR